MYCLFQIKIKKLKCNITFPIIVGDTCPISSFVVTFSKPTVSKGNKNKCLHGTFFWQ